MRNPNRSVITYLANYRDNEWAVFGSAAAATVVTLFSLGATQVCVQ